MAAIHALFALIGVIPLAYLTWRFFKRSANRRGADVEEYTGGFHELGSLPQGLHILSEHQPSLKAQALPLPKPLLLSGSKNNEPSPEAYLLPPPPSLPLPKPPLLSGSGNNEPSLGVSYQRVQPQPLSVRPLPPLPGSENDKQLNKLPPCLKPLQINTTSPPMTRFTFRPENESSLQAQSQIPPAVKPRPHHPLINCVLVIPTPLILELKGIGKELPLLVARGLAQIHASTRSKSEVPPLACIIYHKMTAKEDLLAWEEFPMHEVASENPEELWREIKEKARKELRKFLPRLSK
ncbi:hypothetical protein FVEG_15973 [Fusarium verticillioides 7600]|uniref:Uncharacterized protein n=1 Tax=Gibberella moniliformis (strain M3125 / FGSC 7600) TaxID=334819 RepID=W7M693_GIBM7|nr:hypothetical protein FVEG_15973 [Fusarium verticillioides 7600]EWG46536.1 hypothetical protein FVEG_15973 [Fusarium verticillioides 7600]